MAYLSNSLLKNIVYVFMNNTTEDMQTKRSHEKQ